MDVEGAVFGMPVCKKCVLTSPEYSYLVKKDKDIVYSTEEPYFRRKLKVEFTQREVVNGEWLKVD
jgi:hypothetical protein